MSGYHTAEKALRRFQGKKSQRDDAETIAAPNAKKGLDNQLSN